MYGCMIINTICCKLKMHTINVVWYKKLKVLNHNLCKPLLLPVPFLVTIQDTCKSCWGQPIAGSIIAILHTMDNTLFYNNNKLFKQICMYLQMLLRVTNSRLHYSYSALWTIHYLIIIMNYLSKYVCTRKCCWGQPTAGSIITMDNKLFHN